jgi:glycosyltransferase involved in cell wall biosynthesis
VTAGRRIAVVSSEILGRAGTGGAGTADSLLAVALGRHGHDVRLLVATGREIGELDPAWSGIYAAAGVEIRFLERIDGITPDFMRPAFEVLHALREDPPELAIVNDWRGLGCLAQRARQVDLALTETAFVVHCHGSARVLAAFARKVPDTLARFGEQVLERGSVELADALVSPSWWLLDWMLTHGWPVPVPDSHVIPYLRSTVLDEPPELAPLGQPVRRLAFFGQLREGKGIRLYLEALNALDETRLAGLELVFVGRESKRWTRETISRALPAAVARAGAVRFETSLDRTSALAELRRPGTLALMPSLLDNSPNTVLECLEHGIPFLATNVGGIPELVAPEDRPRVLCEPTVADLAAALRRALEAQDGFAPATSAHDPADSARAWLELVDTLAPRERPRPRERAKVDVVATSRGSEERARALVAHSTLAEGQVVRSDSRRAGLERVWSEWILFLDDEDEPSDDLLDRLVAAQRASAADAVTCAVRPAASPDEIRLFLGDPGALGLAANHYGVIALVRRSFVSSDLVPDASVDPDWMLLARLALSGARVVSVPEPLARHGGRPGEVRDVPGDGLSVLETFERAEGAELRDLPQLAATLAAAGAGGAGEPAPRDDEGWVRRGVRVMRDEGARGVMRRVRRHLRFGR